MFSASLRRLIASLSRTYLGVCRPTGRRHRHRFRPEIECLEGRTTPSVDMWTGANFQMDPNWSDGANWSLGHAPTSSDVALFTSNNSVKSYTATIDQAYTVGGLQIDGTWGGTINGAANLTLASGSVNEIDSGTLNTPLGGTIINNGTLTFNGGGAFTIGGGGTLQNNGVINQNGAGNLDLASNGNSITTLNNTATGTYNFGADSGIVNGGFVGGAFVNAGTIEKTAGSGTTLFYTPLTNNNGTLSVASGTLALHASSTNTNGTYQVASNAILDLAENDTPYTHTFTENGTFTAAGLGAGAGTIELAGGVVAAGTTGATFNIPAAVTFQVNGGTINVPLNATLVYNGTLNINSTGAVYLTGGGTFQNNGTINQTGGGNLIMVGAGQTATTLNNTATGVYNFQADSSILSSGGPGNGVITNTGLIEKTNGTNTSQITAAITNNAGTINAGSGTLQLANNSTNTNGTYTAAAGATLDLTGGQTFTENGTFTATGAGVITLNGGIYAVSGNSTLSIPGTITFQWPGAAISVPTNDTLTVNGNLALNGSSNEVLAGGGTLSENGTITQSGSGNLYVWGTNTVATTLLIPKGSVYNFAANSGILQAGAGGVVTNSGTIEKTAGGASSGINTAFNNTGGTLTVTTGTLTLDSQGGENTGGVFSVSAGAILDLTGGYSVNYSGTYTGSGSGEVLLRNGTLNTTGGTNGATFNLPGNLFVWTGGTINTAAGNNFTLLGNMKITGAGTEFLAGTGELNIGTATAAGTLNDTATANTLNLQGATLGINARGTLNLADDTINGIGLLVDQGSLVKTTGTSGATISTTVDSQGKVTVNNGTLLFNGIVDQVINGVLTGGTWTASSSATTAATLDISSATFNTIGVSASVTLSGPNSNFSNLSGLTTNQGTFNLSSGASFATAGSFTNSGSMTLSPGSVLTVNGNFTEGSTGKLTEQIGGTASSPTFGSIAATGTVSLGGTLTVTSTVVVPVNQNVGYEILNNASASPIIGTFAGLPEGATFTVKVGVTTMTFRITYKGGSGGNSVVITRIA
jgi:hypothetical protein